MDNVALRETARATLYVDKELGLPRSSGPVGMLV